MRLTIRTLLGYMDDILDPQDAEAIGKRIEESEVASTLYHRIRDVTRRLSLKAPDLDDEKHGVDPNTVAEYLDNLLPDDRVPDFEKICLESDMHLAEVAACHQILAVALGEAADIEPSSREHMYQLPQVAADLENMDRPPSDPFGLDINATGGSTRNAKVPQRPSPIVPDYLRDSPRRIPTVPIVMGTIVAACLVIILLVVTGVVDFRNGEPKEEEVAQNDQNNQPVLNEPNNKTPGKPGVHENSPENGNVLGDTHTNITPIEPVVSDPKNDFPIVLVTPPKDTGPEKIDPLHPVPEKDPSSPSNAEVSNVPSGLGNLNPPSPSEGGLAPTPVPINPTGGTPTGTDDPGKTNPTTTKTDPQPKTPAATSIGRFISENQTLVRLDFSDKSWKIVPQQGVLIKATSLVALPTFRPIIATPNGLSVQLLSRTQVTMQPVQAGATPLLQLQNGRIILRSLGKQNVRLLLTAGDKTGIVTLVNPESAVAVGLAYHRKPGVDPAEVPSNVEVQFFTIAGKVLWEEKDKKEPLKLDASEYISFTSEEAKPKIKVLATTPDWIQPKPANKLDQNAAAKVLKAFGNNKIASLALRELLDHRQREVSRLALKCLTQLGQLEPAIASLDNTSGRLTWDKTINQLSEMAAQSPAKAKQIKEAFEHEYGDAAPALWRMLWGYTTEQLKNDGAPQLVEYLDRDRLVFRVMSFYNLRKITGKTHLYQPEETPFQRKLPTNRWRKQLKNGEIISKKKTEKGS